MSSDEGEDRNDAAEGRNGVRTHPEIRFDVPARVEYVSLLRLLVSALAADRRDVDDEQLDDLRLALSEACTLVIDNAEPSSRLVVSCVEEPDAWVLDVHDGGGHTLSGADAQSGLPAPERLDEDNALPMELIRALVEDVAKVREDGIERIRMRVRCPPAHA